MLFIPYPKSCQDDLLSSKTLIPVLEGRGHLVRKITFWREWRQGVLNIQTPVKITPNTLTPDFMDRGHSPEVKVSESIKQAFKEHSESTQKALREYL